MAITRYGPDIDDSRDHWRRGPDILTVRHWIAHTAPPGVDSPDGFALGPFSTFPFGAAGSTPA